MRRWDDDLTDKPSSLRKTLFRVWVAPKLSTHVTGVDRGPNTVNAAQGDEMCIQGALSYVIWAAY